MTNANRRVSVVSWLWILIPILLLVLTLSACGKTGGDSMGSNPEPGARHDNTDPDAPKTIVSKEIQSFVHEFNPGKVYSYYEWDWEVLCQYLTFSIERQEDCAKCNFKGVGFTEDTCFDITFVAPATALYELQTIVDAHNLPAYNGRDISVDGIPAYYGGRLRVEYASGEKIYCYDNHSAVISSYASVELLHFFHNLAREAGQDFLYPPEVVKEIQDFMADRWESADDCFALELDGNSLKIYQNNVLTDDTIYYYAFKKIYNEQTESGRFTGFMLFEQRDDCLIGIWEDGREIVFSRSPSAWHE